MRLRALLVGLVLGALLVAFPAVTVASATDYRTNDAGLRALWANDLQAGVSPDQLAPLESQLDKADATTFASLPTVTFNPGASRGFLASLRISTDQIYASDLTSARTSAIAASTALALAIGPDASTYRHLWRQDLAESSTPADYQALADAWQLDAKLVPMDHQLAQDQTGLMSLVAQGKALSISTADASHLLEAITSYFTFEPAARYAYAPKLQAETAPTAADLQTRVQQALQARAAARTAAAANHAASGPYTLYLHLNGNYTDCSGATILSGGLYKDTCIHNTLYLVSHKWSVGASFFNLRVGSIIYLSGRRYTVYHVYTITPAGEESLLGGQQAPLTLQTCYTDSGSVLLMIQAH
jgi:hypothetical protein